ncbi:membrane-spanning 4-domains subfamily A member 8-like [Mantella aurantiaca]
MDFPVSPPCGPVFGIQQQRNLLPEVPHNQEFYKIFLKGQPKVLGAVQITLVLMHWSLGGVLSSTANYVPSTTARSGIPYWASVFYLVSGVLCVTVEIKPKLTLVKWTYAFTAISCLTSLIEISLIFKDSNNITIYGSPSRYPCWNEKNFFEFGMSTYLLFIGKRTLNASKDHIPEVFAINNEYKHFRTCEMSQPGNEKPNYIPLILNIDTPNE